VRTVCYGCRSGRVCSRSRPLVRQSRGATALGVWHGCEGGCAVCWVALHVLAGAVLAHAYHCWATAGLPTQQLTANFTNPKCSQGRQPWWPGRDGLSANGRQSAVSLPQQLAAACQPSSRQRRLYFEARSSLATLSSGAVSLACACLSCHAVSSGGVGVITPS
jgi:hypothetical protein